MTKPKLLTTVKTGLNYFFQKDFTPNGRKQN